MENLSAELILFAVAMVAFGFVLRQLLAIRGILGSMGRITDSMIHRCNRMIKTIGSVGSRQINANRKAAIKQLKKKGRS
jgi:hypothetical protein